MKDIVSAERFSFERIIMQVLVPGLVALGPFMWLLYLVHRPDAASIVGADGPEWLREFFRAGAADRPRPLLTFAQNNKELAAFVALVFAIMAGLIIEDMGSWVEHRYLDVHNRNRSDRNLFPIWDAYLRATDETGKIPAILPTYVASLVPRMKFQLSCSIALMFMAVGMALMFYLGLLRFGTVIFWSVLALVCLVAFIELRKAMSYGRLLHRTRVLELQARGLLEPDYLRPQFSGALPEAGKEVYYTLNEGPSCCSSRWKLLELKASAKSYRLIKVVAHAKAHRGSTSAPRFVFNLPERIWKGACPHFKEGKLKYLHDDVLKTWTPPAP